MWELLTFGLSLQITHACTPTAEEESSAQPASSASKTAAAAKAAVAEQEKQLSKKVSPSSMQVIDTPRESHPIGLSWHYMCTAMQELKKKEMEELDAVFAQFGIEAKAEDQAEGGKKKKNRKKVQAEGGAEAASVSKPEPAAATAADSEESEDEDNGAPVDPAVVRPTC